MGSSVITLTDDDGRWEGRKKEANMTENIIADWGAERKINRVKLVGFYDRLWTLGNRARKHGFRNCRVRVRRYGH